MNIYRPVLRGFLSIFILALLVTCSDDEGIELCGTNLCIEDIAGNWNATQASFGAVTGPAMSVDVVADGGTVTMSIQNNGTFSVTITVIGEAPEVSNGQMSFDEDLLVVSFSDSPEDFEFFSITHNEPMLNISGGNGSVEFDLDGDGVDDPANIDFVMERL